MCDCAWLGLGLRLGLGLGLGLGPGLGLGLGLGLGPGLGLGLGLGRTWSRLMPPGPCKARSIMPPITWVGVEVRGRDDLGGVQRLED